MNTKRNSQLRNMECKNKWKFLKWKNISEINIYGINLLVEWRWWRKEWFETRSLEMIQFKEDRNNGVKKINCFKKLGEFQILIT